MTLSLHDLANRHTRRCSCGRSLQRSRGEERCASCRHESGPSEIERAAARRAEERAAFNAGTTGWAARTLKREAARRARGERVGAAWWGGYR